ncbi:hypothetical protein MML48_scaffold00004435 [Holotrichia oblita]|nr:hypothetical protein MML48_scaffold00004435 [Holotrichia oblita]
MWSVLRKYHQKDVIKDHRIGTHTAVEWFNFFRDVMTKIAWHEYVPIGGPDDVEVDESHLFKRGVSRTTGRVFAVTVHDRTQNTLIEELMELVDFQSEQWSDEGKRKNDDGEEMFQRSKKTRRSPTKSDNPKESMMTQMNEMMIVLKNLAGDIKEMKVEQSSNKEETKILQEEIRKLRAEQEGFKNEMKQLRDIHEKATEEIDILKKEVKVANEEIEKLKAEKRRKI